VVSLIIVCGMWYVVCGMLVMWYVVCGMCYEFRYSCVICLLYIDDFRLLLQVRKLTLTVVEMGQ
jgi:hypothetical protein